MPEDDLLRLFDQLNVKTGNLNSNVIKAWFDTECEDFLKWLCCSINEECYITAQQEFEFSQLDNVFTNDELNKKLKLTETLYPDFLEVDLNLLNIEIAKDTVEILEEQLKNYDHQLQINQKLNESLSVEFSKISSEGIKAQLDKEVAQENCTKLSIRLDDINKETFAQVTRYSFYLSNFQFIDFPNFTNSMDMLEPLEKLTEVINNITAIMKIDDLLEMSSAKFLNHSLVELQDCLFHTKISNVVLKMEVEALEYTLNFLENCDLHIMYSFMDCDKTMLTVDLAKDQQNWMLKEIEETALKMSEQYVNEPSVKYSKSELEFCLNRSSYLTKCKQWLEKNLLHFILLYKLNLQEKMDVSSSRQFFRNIRNYICKDVEATNFRREAMFKLNEEFKMFCNKPIEKKFKLIEDVGLVLSKNDVPLVKVMKEGTLLKSKTKQLKKQQLSSITSNMIISKELMFNIQVLEKFLLCGPTLQNVIIPHKLWKLFIKINQSLTSQNSAVKLLLQAAQKPKDKFLKNKWLHYQNLLWKYYVTDYVKMLSFLDQIKAD
jgi:hypothetical protein